MSPSSERSKEAPPLAVPADSDRRDSPRVAVERIAVRIGSQSVLGTGDLSVGGLRWTGPAPHLLTSPLEVAFQLPGDAESLHLQAEVLRREEADAGIVLRLRFVDPPLEAERRIARFIDQLNTRDAQP